MRGMDYSYYGRLDKINPTFTIGYQIMNERIKKTYENELERFRLELNAFIENNKQEYVDDLRMVRVFVDSIRKAFVSPKPKKNQNCKKPKMKGVKDKTKEVDEHLDYNQYF